MKKIFFFCLFLFILPIGVEGASYTVSDSNSGKTDFPSLLDAIDFINTDTNSGHTLVLVGEHIANNNWSKFPCSSDLCSYVLSKPLTIDGNGNKIIDYTNVDSHLFYFNSNNITIKDLIIEDSRYVIRDLGSNNLIINNTFQVNTGRTKQTIRLHNSINTVVINNTFKGVDQGIYITSDSNNAVIQYNVFTDSRKISWGFDILYNTFKNHSIEHNMLSKLQVAGADGLNILDNVSFPNLVEGAFYSAQITATVTDGSAKIRIPFNVTLLTSLSYDLNTIQILKDNGSGWEALNTTVNTEEGWAEATVASFSNFTMRADKIDSDGDGITDNIDVCPLTPEDFDGYQDSDGCPEDNPIVTPLTRGSGSSPSPILHLIANSVDYNLNIDVLSVVFQDHVFMHYDANTVGELDYVSPRDTVLYLGGTKALYAMGDVILDAHTELENYCLLPCIGEYENGNHVVIGGRDRLHTSELVRKWTSEYY